MDGFWKGFEVKVLEIVGLLDIGGRLINYRDSKSRIIYGRPSSNYIHKVILDPPI